MTSNILQDLSISGIISIVGNSQRTFLAIIRTVSILSVGLHITIGSFWILLSMLLIFILNILEYYTTNKNFFALIKVYKTSNPEDNKIIRKISGFNKTIYGYSIILIIVLFISLLKYEHIKHINLTWLRKKLVGNTK